MQPKNTPLSMKQSSWNFWPKMPRRSNLLSLQIQEGDKADVDKAVAAAREAMKRNSPWRKMNPNQRGKILNKIADIIERDSAMIASVEVIDNGKPFFMALYDVLTGINMFRFVTREAFKELNIIHSQSQMWKAEECEILKLLSNA